MIRKGSATLWLVFAIALLLFAFINIGLPNVQAAQKAASSMLANSPSTAGGFSSGSQHMAPALTPCTALGNWQTAASLDQNVWGAAVASDGQYLYSAGGYTDSNQESDELLRYNPISQTWTLIDHLPVGLDSASAIYVPLNNKLYIFGGFAQYPFQQALNTAAVYDLNAHTWSSLNMPGARFDMAAAYLNGKIYLVGGDDFGNFHSQTWEYDPVANTWATLADIPTNIAGAVGAAQNGHLYVVGGYRIYGHTTLNTTYDYDIASNSWTTDAAMPSATAYAGGTLVNGRIYVFGGAILSSLYAGNHAPNHLSPAGETQLNITQIYDIASNQWSFGPNLNNVRVSVTGAALGSVIYAVGGASSVQNSVERANIAPCSTVTPPPTNTPTSTPTSTDTPPACNGGVWAAAAPLPHNLTEFASVQAGNDFYAVGGITDYGMSLFYIQHYNAISNSWTTSSQAPNYIHYDPAAGFWNGKIYVFGGDGGSILQVYDIASDTWSADTSHYEPGVSAAASGIWNGKFYVAGGAQGQPSTQMLIYDIASQSWSTLNNLPIAYAYGGSTVVGQYLYTVGGVGSGITATMRLDMATGAWSVGPAFPMARSEAAVAYDGQRLYAIGGKDGSGQSSAEVDALDLGNWPNGNWVQSPLGLPTARYGGGGAFTNVHGNSGGEIWSVGGLGSVGELNENLYRSQSLCATSTVTVIPSATSTVTPQPTAPCSTLGPWGFVNPMPAELTDNTVASDGTYIYSAGGYGQTGLFLRYDPSANYWSSLPSMPDPTFLASAVYAPINGKVYVFGGETALGGSFATNRIYNPATLSWSIGTPMPFGGISMAAAYWNGKIFIASTGSGGGGVLWEYDVLADSWDVTRAPIPTSIQGAAAGVVGNHLFIFGGSVNPQPFTNVTYDYDIMNNVWTTRANIPTAISNAAGAVLDGHIYIVGGNTSTGVTAITQIYDPATDSWSSGPSLNTARSSNGAAVVGGVIFVVGGYNGNNNGDDALASVERTSFTCVTVTPIVTATPPPTVCPNPFDDINGNVFFAAINTLYCQGIVNGTSSTTYSPSATASRAQFAKVVTLGFGLPIYTPTSGQDFTDVPPNYFAYSYIEAGFHAGILNGFDAQSCQNANAMFPCYLPNRPITRGQLTKLVVSAARYPLFTPTTPTFIDVPPQSVFYTSIETAHHMGVINGYPDTSFHPNNNIRRDEMAQIVFKAITTP